MIDDHLYDSGPVNTHGPCIAESQNGDPHCGAAEGAHAYSEYSLAPDGRAPHDEPDLYPARSLHFNDDSYDHLIPYVD